MKTPQDETMTPRGFRGRFRSSGLPRSSKIINTRRKSPRPSISGPIGPVHNSRGPDFSRSKTIVIVDSIQDCVSDLSTTPDEEVLHPPTSTRCLSATFPSAGSATASPTVERSNVTATSKIQVPPNTRAFRPLRDSSIGFAAPRPVLKANPVTTQLPRLKAMVQNENAAPPGGFAQEKPLPPLPRSKLPKSRTMGVLRDLRTSLSRSSLNVRSAKAAIIEDYPCQTPSVSSNSTLKHPEASKHQISQTSLASVGESTISSISDPLPDEITSAQSSAYWSGRFMALHDRFSSETLPTDSSGSTSESEEDAAKVHAVNLSHSYANVPHYRPSKLCYSNTTSALPTLTSISSTTAKPNREAENDTRCRRVFFYLESRCRTSEARQSLRDWQQSYARRQGRPNLLPEGGSMEDQKRGARFFTNGSNSARNGTRKSLSSLRELASSSLGKITSGSKSSAGRGKRVAVD